MKKFIYWLMGERAGCAIARTWNWLWGLPVESDSQIAVEVAQESLESMQQSVVQLTQSVSTVVAAYQRAKEKYENKVKEFRWFENQAMISHRQGNEEAARLSMTKAILVEQILPQLEEQVAQTEKLAIAAKDRLNRERQKLETYKVHMQNLQDLSEINEALAAIAINDELNIDSDRSQFEAAQAAVQHRYWEAQAQAELYVATETLSADLEKITLDDEVTRRLQKLEETQAL